MKTNPFSPNSSVHPGMFIGRIEELQRVKQALVQTRFGQPAHFMVTGERQIGKTSWCADREPGLLNGQRGKFSS